MPLKTVTGLLVLTVLVACSGGGGGSNTGGAPTVQVAIGDPILGLPEAQQQAFMRGKFQAERRFSVGDGLGPFFNAVSCQSCHEIPVVGGSAPGYRNFFLVGLGPAGSQSAVFPLPSLVMPSYGALQANRPAIPDPLTTPFPVVRAQRNAPSMLGVGLFEFVSDATIIALADPDDADSDGISGRYNRDGATGTIGRLGYKAQANSLEAFLRGALLNQMGITTVPIQGSAGAVHYSGAMMPQVSSNPDFPNFDLDQVPDPEMSFGELDDLLTFSRFLAPPARKPMTASAEAGEVLFDQIGCTKCHVPTIESTLGPLAAYSDLLIHDMGSDLADGISQGSPQPSALAGNTTTDEFRTQPLWGVSMHAPYLHDGRADTLTDAIMAHGGEGQGSRDAFNALTVEERQNILTFLESL